MHIPDLFSDLALILVVATITTLLFKWLKQPVVLGYILAGILSGPHTDFFITVHNVDNIKLWGDIGVVFLLFSLGLEFSYKKLSKVGGTGIITALTEFLIMFSIGFTIGHFMGWSVMDSVFLGGMLTISSTTIIIKAFEELGIKKHKFTHIVFGVLVVEDLIAVLQLVLLSTIAISRDFNGQELGFSLLKLVFFIVSFFVIGIFIIPTFFKKTRKIMGEETMLITAIGFCFATVFLADNMGFSSALGAFLMGSILAETIESEKILKLITPLKYLFGAVFFVSVGMLVDFKIITTSILPIIIITCAVVFIKTFSATIGVLISGQPLKVAVQSGFSLSQIGEFSFIIATLGLQLKVIHPMIYSIIVMVSVITTFSTPYMIKFSERFYNWLYKNIPSYWRNVLNQYASTSKAVSDKNYIKIYVKRYLLIILIYTALMTSILAISLYVLRPFLHQYLPNLWAELSAFLVTLLVMAPILMALIMKKIVPNMKFEQIWRKNRVNKIQLMGLVLLRLSIAFIFVTILITSYYKFKIGITVALGITILFAIVSSRKNLHQYIHIEERFLQNLNAKNTIPELLIPQNLENDMHMETLEVSLYSDAIGKTLSELAYREKFNINIISILRGYNRIDLPDRDERLYPQDKLLVIGSDEQLKIFKTIVEKEEDSSLASLMQIDMNLFQLSISSYSKLIGKSIKENGFRDIYHCLVIAIVQNNQFTMNPPSSTVIQNGNLLWIVGRKEMIKKLENLGKEDFN